MIGPKGFVFTSGEIRESGVGPNLAMRVWVAGARQLAAVLKDLYVLDPGNLCELAKLFGPSVDHAAQFTGVHAWNREIVAW